MAKKRRFPHRRECRRGLVVEIRKMQEKDISKLQKLHKSLTKMDRALLREDVLSPYYKRLVKRQIEDKFEQRLVAWYDDKIVGSLTLYRSRERWLSHTCEIRAITHPDFRKYGITTALIEEAIPFAKTMGIEKIFVNIMPEQKAAAKLAKSIGFQREATYVDHVKDEYGMYHDVRRYSLDMEAAFKAMDTLLSKLTESDE